MADEANAGEGGPELKSPEDDELTFVDWDYRLLSLERIHADPEDEDGEDLFTAKFQVDGPNANAEIEIIVSDVTDEANVVAIAQHTLHVSLTMWSRITSDRLIRARASDLPKRGTSRRR